jgi:hypothetical protein
MSPHLADVFPLLLFTDEQLDGLKSPEGIGLNTVKLSSEVTYSASLVMASFSSVVFVSFRSAFWFMMA